MARTFTKAALGAVAAMMIAGAAQAGDYYTYGGGHGGYRPVQSYGGGGYGYGGGGHHGGGSGYGGGYYGRPSGGYGGWHGGGHGGCRLIIKKRINRWGEMVVTRIRRCG